MFDELKFKTYLWKGQLHNAVDYLGKYKEKEALFIKYINTFNEGQYCTRTNNEVIAEIDKIYQEYYKNILWRGVEKKKAEKALFSSLKNQCNRASQTMLNDEVENEIAGIVAKEGYQFLGGQTSGWYGPYIWKTSTSVTYQVELPNGIETLPVIMMDDFISRSWLDYISFGITGTGGWVDKDGTICCVKTVYDIGSNEFNISLLKHEAQHRYDIEKFPGISAADLEYRAKLVELVYWPDSNKMIEILGEADNSNPDHGHLIAAHRIVTELSKKIFNCEYMESKNVWTNRAHDITRYSLELLRFDEIRLQALSSDIDNKI